jgi:outer membrane protein assembly factor BamB
MSYRLLHAATYLCLVFLSSHVLGNDWPAWRGPSATGSIEDGEFNHQFDAKTYQWRAELPGKGCSTPIVINDQIIVTAPIDGNDAILSFDRNGKELWRTAFGKENAGKHRNGSGSNASPVSDGNAAFVFYKSGMFAAVELDGKVRWKTDLVERFGKDTLFWDHGTSPVLTEKHVVMARMHHGESWLAAFDKATGEIAWKVARNYETPTECDHGYTTPVVFRYQDKEALLVWGAEHVTIHDAADGKVIYSCGNFNPEANQLWPAIATPVIVDKTAVIAYGRNDRGTPRLHGVRLEGSGDVTDSAHAWDRDDIGTFVPTPVVYKGKVIVVGDQGEVECIAADTGETVWKDALPKHRNKYYASPLVAGDKLYAPREDGVVFVASIADGKFELLSENDMGEPVIGSPVPVDNQILIRGEQHLFCIGPQK